MAENKRELTVSVDVDVTDAIKALKALQREAKEATRALRELESISAELHEGERVLTTKELQAKLEQRTGVKTYKVAPHHEKATLMIDHGNGFDSIIPIDGPAIITINKD